MNKESFLFLVLVVAIFLFGYFIFFRVGVSLTKAILVIVVIALIFIFFPRIVEFKQYERGVVLRMGRFNRVAGPGWTWIFPFFDKYVLIDERVTALDVRPQNVITNDDIKIIVDAVIYYKIMDPKKAVLNVVDYASASSLLVESEIRNSIAKLDLQEVLEKTSTINNILEEKLRNIAENWGIKILQVEIKTITLPSLLLEAMQKRRAATEFKKRLQTEAAGRSLSLDILNEAATRMSDRTLAYLYLEALKNIAEGKSTKLIYPLELSHLAASISKKIKPETKGEYESVVNDLIKTYIDEKKKTLEKELKEKRKGLK